MPNLTAELPTSKFVRNMAESRICGYWLMYGFLCAYQSILLFVKTYEEKRIC